MNTASQHTPGPYEVQPLQSSHGAELAIVATSAGWVVAVIGYDPEIQTVDDPDYDTVVRYPQDVPNANLLAAAPDMLDACRAMLAAFGGDIPDWLADEAAQMEAAIAKATAAQP